MGIGNLSNKKTINSVLGIDASTNSVAFCLYDKTGPVKWGEIKFKGNTVFERLADAQGKVKAALGGLSPDLIIFESAVFVQNKKTVVLLAYAFGSIVGSIMKPGIKVEEVPPVTWQNFIGNKSLSKIEKDAFKKDHPNQKTSWYSNEFRKIRKQRTMDWVKTQFNIDVPNDNVSDAIGVAHFGWDKFGP